MFPGDDEVQSQLSQQHLGDKSVKRTHAEVSAIRSHTCVYLLGGGFKYFVYVHPYLGK